MLESNVRIEAANQLSQITPLTHLRRIIEELTSDTTRTTDKGMRNEFMIILLLVLKGAPEHSNANGGESVEDRFLEAGYIDFILNNTLRLESLTDKGGRLPPVRCSIAQIVCFINSACGNFRFNKPLRSLSFEKSFYNSHQSYAKAQLISTISLQTTSWFLWARTSSPSSQT